jgi:hypothetical protein
MPASHRSLVMAALDRDFASKPPSPPDPEKAVATALSGLSPGASRRVLVLASQGDVPSDEHAATAPWAAGLGDALIPLALVTPADGDREARVRAVKAFVPACGEERFHDVVVAFDGTPAPAHVLEASGGEARWELEGGELALGDVRAGEERAEVVRVTIPAWTPGEDFTLHVNARFRDLAGEARTMGADLKCTYDDDVQRLAESRHGDVIAYASALATLSRLDAAFVGGGSGTAADLRPVARMHARSLALLARDMKDPAAAEQAALLEALLSVVP